MATVSPAQVEKYLKGLDFPASKDDLAAHAEKQGADDGVLEVIRQLPERNYERPTDVAKAIGEIE